MQGKSLGKIIAIFMAMSRDEAFIGFIGFIEFVGSGEFIARESF